MKIGIIGAGNVGGSLGSRLSKSGFEVKFGLKEGKDASDLLARCAGDASAGSVEEAARFGDIVFLAVPGSVAVDVARSLAPLLEGKVLVDCNNALTWKGRPVWDPPAEGSLTAAIAKVAPGARAIKAFNGFGAEHHADPNLTGVPATVFLAGDDDGAKQRLSEVAARAGFAPVDAGPLSNAAVLENAAILWIHLALAAGHGRQFIFHMRRS